MSNESPQELLELHGSAVGEVQRLVDGVSPAHLPAATPCGEWDVQSLLGHLVAGNRRFEAAATGGSLRALIGDIAPDGDAAAYADSARTARAAWQQPAALAGDSAPMLVTVHLIESVVHGWDLARATEQEPAFDPRILEAIEPFARGMMPTERPPAMGFGAERPASAHAATIDRLAAFFGREV